MCCSRPVVPVRGEWGIGMLCSPVVDQIQNNFVFILVLPYLSKEFQIFSGMENANFKFSTTTDGSSKQ